MSRPPMDPARWKSLWEKLEAFEIDAGEAQLDFNSRLARENGWTRRYAARVVNEYRRFLLLACAAGHPVTPSDQVDQAWHLHLTYTRSYWDRLCGQVLLRPLHHEPTRGGEQEADRFRAQYEETLRSYAKIFGAPAPPDIWPSAEVRFGADLHFRRVRMRDYWWLRKPTWRMRAGEVTRV